MSRRPRETECFTNPTATSQDLGPVLWLPAITKSILATTLLPASPWDHSNRLSLTLLSRVEMTTLTWRLELDTASSASASQHLYGKRASLLKGAQQTLVLSGVDEFSWLLNSEREIVPPCWFQQFFGFSARIGDVYILYQYALVATKVSSPLSSVPCMTKANRFHPL